MDAVCMRVCELDRQNTFIFICQVGFLAARIVRWFLLLLPLAVVLAIVKWMPMQKSFAFNLTIERFLVSWLSGCFLFFFSLSRERALAGLTPINIAMHMHARQEKPIESFHFSHILYIVRHEYFMVNFEATAAAFAPRNKSRGIQLQVQWIHSMPLQFYDRIFFCVWRIPCMHSAKW